MSQPSVTAYFNLRKRPAADELKSSRTKILVLEREQSHVSSESKLIQIESDHKKSSNEDSKGKEVSPKIIYTTSSDQKSTSMVGKAHSAVRNLQFDKASPKINSRVRAMRSRKIDGQSDIRETFLKLAETPKNVLFEKKGTLSPRKAIKPNTPSKDSVNEEPPAVGSTTPKKKRISPPIEGFNLDQIKARMRNSPRFNEFNDRLQRKLEARSQLESEPKIKEFEKIELEIPVSPQKAARSPLKTPKKNVQVSPTASPQRRLLFEPKEDLPTPASTSPVKSPAYKRFQQQAESGPQGLSLPYDYKFLCEVFRCIETVAAMLFNRKETITFRKLKPAVQELLQRDFNLKHLAQIKAVFPEAYSFSQDKLRNFGSASKQDKYELVLTPIIEVKSTSDADNGQNSTSTRSMNPGILLERQRKFFNLVLDRVKTEHEKFLLALDPPIVIPRDKLLRWHPAFPIGDCPAIEEAELPQAPKSEKASTAQEVLESAKKLFGSSTRIEKSLQRLADAKQARDESLTQVAPDKSPVRASVVDTPPSTPTTQCDDANPALRGISKSLLERVRARQAAKNREAMMRTPSQNKEAMMYSRLPDLAKLIRNIFVAEKKSVLRLDFLMDKLDNSYRTKLTSTELDEHLRLICKLLPKWASILHVRQMDHFKIAKDMDMGKVVKHLENLANHKVEKTS